MAVQHFRLQSKNFHLSKGIGLVLLLKRTTQAFTSSCYDRFNICPFWFSSWNLINRKMHGGKSLGKGKRLYVSSSTLYLCVTTKSKVRKERCAVKLDLFNAQSLSQGGVGSAAVPWCFLEKINVKKLEQKKKEEDRKQQKRGREISPGKGSSSWALIREKLRMQMNRGTASDWWAAMLMSALLDADPTTESWDQHGSCCWIPTRWNSGNCTFRDHLFSVLERKVWAGLKTRVNGQRWVVRIWYFGSWNRGAFRNLWRGGKILVGFLALNCVGNWVRLAYERLYYIYHGCAEFFFYIPSLWLTSLL